MQYVVFAFEQGRMILTEIAPEITLETLRKITTAEYAISPDLKTIRV